MKDDIYIVVAENDQHHKRINGEYYFDDGGPLVFEQYAKDADLESIQK